MTGKNRVSINEIVAHIAANPFSKPYNYVVEVIGGTGMHPDMSESVSMNCSSVGIAGINVGAFQTQRYGVGLREMFAMAKSFTDVHMSFYQSADEKERKYFSEWFNVMYNRDTKKIGFKSDYTKTIIISEFDKTNKLTYVCELIDAFPTNISPIDKGYQTTDTIPQINVNFQFTDMKEYFAPDLSKGV